MWGVEHEKGVWFGPFGARLEVRVPTSGRVSPTDPPAAPRPRLPPTGRLQPRWGRVSRGYEPASPPPRRLRKPDAAAAWGFGAHARAQGRYSARTRAAPTVGSDGRCPGVHALGPASAPADTSTGSRAPAGPLPGSLYVGPGCASLPPLGAPQGLGGRDQAAGGGSPGDRDRGEWPARAGGERGPDARHKGPRQPAPPAAVEQAELLVPPPSPAGGADRRGGRRGDWVHGTRGADDSLPASVAGCTTRGTGNWGGGKGTGWERGPGRVPPGAPCFARRGPRGGCLRH